MVKHAIVSMTGFAARRGGAPGAEWAWDIRSVNGKGLDLRLRLPEGIEGLEPAVRAAVSAAAHRGNVTVGLKLQRANGAEALRVNPAGLTAVLTMLRAVEAAAREMDFELQPVRATDVAAMRGVLDPAQGEADQSALLAALMADFEALVADFGAARRAEGARIGAVIAQQVERIAALTEVAAEAAEARRPAVQRALNEALARVLEGAAEADPQRVAQELAMLAVKADVTEEIDRLHAHVAAARSLLADGGAVGRRLDFLMQEFMREANTLCSKSGSTELTRIGLDLKTVIDQMREQVQNVE